MRHPNVIELDPGLRAFLRTPAGRDVRKRRELRLVVARRRRELELGSFVPTDKNAAWQQWAAQVHELHHVHRMPLGEWCGLPQYDAPAEVFRFPSAASARRLTRTSRA